MDSSRVEDNWQGYLDSKIRERRKSRQKRIHSLLFSCIGLLIVVISWEQSAKSRSAERAKVSAAVIQTAEQEEALRFADPAHAEGEWRRELATELEARRAWMLDCMPDRQLPALTWHFSYQPEIGELLHREFEWPAGAGEPEASVRLCLQKAIEQDFVPSSIETGHWYKLKFTY